MPAYRYQCGSCGCKFEKFQNMSTQPLKECPKCGKGIRRSSVTGMGIIFKGKGFYPTDYENNHFSDKTCCGRSELATGLLA